MEGNYWLFAAALIALSITFGIVVERIERKRHEKEKQKALNELRKEFAAIVERNRKALGDAVVDNILSNNSECRDITDACTCEGSGGL